MPWQRKENAGAKTPRKKTQQPPKLIYCALGYLWWLLYFKKLGVTPRSGTIRETARVLIRREQSCVALGLYLYRRRAAAGNAELCRGVQRVFPLALAFIFRLLQIIPKKNFTPDIYTIKEIARILRSGGRVILFPEGMSSSAAGTSQAPSAAAKLLKHFGVPVYVSKISGGYLTSTNMPRRAARRSARRDRQAFYAGTTRRYERGGDTACARSGDSKRRL